MSEGTRRARDTYAKLIIVGNLGRDPVLRYTADGTPVCSFSVASSRRVLDGNGGYKEQTTWWRVSAWRKLAESCHKYLAKGRRVLVEAEVVKAHGYKTRDGEIAASLEVTADRVVFLSSRDEALEGGQPRSAHGSDRHIGQDLDGAIEGIHGAGPDDEIPF